MFKKSNCYEFVFCVHVHVYSPMHLYFDRFKVQFLFAIAHAQMPRGHVAQLALKLW